MKCPRCNSETDYFTPRDLTPEEREELRQMAEFHSRMGEWAKRTEKMLQEHMEKNRYRKD